MRKMRYLTAALCAVVLLCGYALPAYASGEAWESVEETIKQPLQTAEPTPTATPTPEPTPTPTPTPQPSTAPSGTGAVVNTPVISVPAASKSTGSVTPAVSADQEQDKAESSENETTGGVEWDGLTPVNPLTPDGQGTLLDNATGEEGKEFFTITTADESVFYLVIDRQKSGENVYFLNTVTVADLLSLAEQNGDALSVITPTPEPEPAPAPTVEPEPDPEPEQKSSSGMGTLLLALAVVAVGGGAGWYFKIYRPKQQMAADLEDDVYPSELEPEFEDGYDDTPPWDEDDTGEGE